jgi:hypothetical protein
MVESIYAADCVRQEVAMKRDAITRIPDGLLEIFLWEGNRAAALAEARDGGCALALWFKLAQAREKFRDECAAWLGDVHARYGARFGKVAAKSPS